MVKDLRGNRGQALTEFILIAPILAIILLGTYQFIRINLVAERVHMAAREGARLRSLTKYDSGRRRGRAVASDSDIKEKIQEYLKTIPGPLAEVTIGNEVILVTKEVKIIPGLKRFLPDPYKLTASCTMTGDPWMAGINRLDQ